MGLLFPMLCAAQNVTVEEPEFNGQAVYLTSDSTAVALKKEYGGMSAKVKGSSFIPYAGAFAGGVNMYLTVKGPESPNVIPAGGDVRLVVRVDNNDEDPEGIIRVMNFEVKKKERRIRFMESSLAGGTKTEESESYLTYNAKKYGENCYLITIPQSELQQGCEYGVLSSPIGAMGNATQQAIVTFGYK